MKKKEKIKKILFLVEQIEYSRYYYYLFSSFQKKENYRIIVININYSLEFTESIEKFGIKTKSVGLKKTYFRNSILILKTIKNEKPDIIHGHEISPTFFGAIYKLLNQNVKLIYHRHHNFSKSLKLKTFSYINTIFANKIITVSKGSKDYAIKEFPFSRNKVGVIYNAISTQHAENKTEKLLVKGQFKIKLGMLARFRPEKNHYLSLELLAHLVLKGYDCCLVFAGSGPYLSKVKQKANELKIYNRVFFCGPIQDVSVFFNFIDIHLIPSSSESFGLVAIEAMENKTINVASNVGGLSEILKNGETGFLFESNNIEEFVEKTSFVIQNPFIKEQLEKTAYLTWENEFSPIIMANNYLNLYRSMLKNDEIKN